MSRRPSRSDLTAPPGPSSALPFVAGLIILLVVGAAILAGRSNLDAAKQVRIADRSALVTRFVDAGIESYNAPAADKIVLSPDDAAANEAQLSSIRTNGAGQSILGAVVVGVDGHRLGARPGDFDIPDAVIRPALDEAIATVSIVITPVFEFDGEPVRAAVEPLGDGNPWGALVMVEPLRGGWLEGLYSGLGSMGGGEGGITLLDANGVVAASWDPSRVGELSPLQRLSGTSGVHTEQSSVDGEAMTFIAFTAETAGLTMVYEEADATLFGDLVAAQRQRDLTVIAAAVLALALLAAFSTLRQRAVLQAHRRTDALLASAHDIVMLVDRDGVVRFVSPTVAAMLGCGQRDVLGRLLHELVLDDHRPRLDEAIAGLDAQGRSDLLGVQLRCPNGPPVWFDLHLALDADPHLPGQLVTCHEIGDRRALEEVLAHRAAHDSLTDLGNRTTFDTSLEQIGARPEPFAVLMIDLDHFKPLNDSLGHDAGDAALRAVAACLRDAVRTTDVVCRLGGDEFGIVLAHTDSAQAFARAERIIAAIRDAWPRIDGSVELDSSIGIAVAHGPVHAPSALVRLADSAMYQAKQDGGGHAVLAPAAPDDPDLWSGHASTPRRTSTEDHPLEPTDRHRSADTATSARSARHRVLTSTRGGLVTWGSTLALTLALVTAGFVANARAMDRLERARLDDRIELLSASNRLNSSLIDSDALMTIVASSMWAFDDPDVMAFVLGLYASAPALGPDGFAVMLDTNGEPIAASPADARAVIDTSDPLWAEALDGTVYMTPVAFVADEAIGQLVLPVTGTDPIEHLLVLGWNHRTAPWSDRVAKLGTLTDSPGGISVTDLNGVATISWDHRLIGTQVLSDELLSRLAARVTDGDVLVEEVPGPDGDQLVIAALVPGSHPVNYGIWTQEASSMFADLHDGQATRDLALAVIVAIALFGLAVVSRRAERTLRRSEGRLGAPLQLSHDIVVVLAPDRSIRFVSAAAAHQLGVDPSSLVDGPLASLVGDDAGPLIHVALDHLSGTSTTALPGQQLIATDGSPRWFDIDLTALRGTQGMAGFLITLHDVTPRIRLEQLLTNQATTDPLTGLLNRAEFGARLDDLTSRRSRQVGSDAILFIDLDHFKPINDTFGHQAGDEVLRVMADRLTATVRAEDFVCRLGGDEFAILLADCDLDLARATVDASVGIALSRTEITNAEELVRAADQAMYEAKRGGRGRYVVDA